MANYSLTVGSNFEPFSFERFVLPLQMYGEAYKEIEENLAALETAAGEWENKANQLTDPIAHALYMKYAEDIKKQADALVNYGLDVTRRRKMLDMRRRYASEIIPIAEAYERRRQLADEQRSARMQDPSMRFSTDYATASLDLLLLNPELSYDPLSGEWIKNEAAASVANMAKSALRDPEYSKVMDEQYWEIRQQTGYTREEIDAAINKDANAPKELIMIIDDIHKGLQESGNRAYDKDWADTWIRRGLYQGGIGGINTAYQANGEYINATARMQDATLRYGINVNASVAKRGQDIQLKIARENNATQRELAKLRAGGVSVEQLDGMSARDLSKSSVAYIGGGMYVGVDMSKKGGFFEPFAFNTGGKHGGHGFTRVDITTPENRMSDYNKPGGWWTSRESYSYIEDTGTRNQIRGYVRNTLGFGQQLPNSVIDKIANNLVVYTDWNGMQWNRWMVTLPGVDADGAVKDPNKVQGFFTKATEAIRGYEGTVRNGHTQK